MGDDRPKVQRSGRINGSSVLTPPTGVPAIPDDARPFGADVRCPDAAALSADAAPDLPVPSTVWLPAEVSNASPGSCLCGHGLSAHEHWRSGSDCGVCGAGAVRSSGCAAVAPVVF